MLKPVLHFLQFPGCFRALSSVSERSSTTLHHTSHDDLFVVFEPVARVLKLKYGLCFVEAVTISVLSRRRMEAY